MTQTLLSALGFALALCFPQMILTATVNCGSGDGTNDSVTGNSDIIISGR